MLNCILAMDAARVARGGDMNFTLSERLRSLFDHLDLQRAHVATQLPAEISDFVRENPQRIAGLLCMEAIGLDSAPFQSVADRMVIVAGDRGMSAKVAEAAAPMLAGARRVILRDYGAPVWADSVSDHAETVISALLTLTGEATSPAATVKSGEHAGVTYSVHGTGPALLLFPLFLSSAQWKAALPAISRHYTVFVLGGPYLGGVALLEDRAASPSYAAMVHTVLDVMNPSAGQTLLETGAGSGAVARIAARHKPAIGPLTAVDINEFLLHEAKALAQRDGLDDRITFAPGNAESLPFADASFDHAFTVTVLEECDADVALRELLRVVKPGGRVGVIVRAIDMPYPWNVDVAEDIKRKIEQAPALIGPRGVADRSVYPRMRKAGFTELTCFPMLSSFDQIGGPFWSYLESRVVSRLTSDEAVAFLEAMTQAREAGVLFCSCPHHCVVGRKPVG